MSTFDAFRFDGKRVLVVGGATGMGAAAAQVAMDAGAQVVVMDFAEVTQPGVQAIHVNLADRASIDAAVDACGGPVHALLACAGVADGTPGIERINFVGHRHLIDRALAAGLLGRGAAIGFISSAAGLGWEAHLDELRELLALEDFDAGAQWFQDKGKADYMSTKQAICAYVASQAMPMLKRGIRINAICPGPTDTPLFHAQPEKMREALIRAIPLRRVAQPEEIAEAVMFFLGRRSDYITGQVLSVSGGLTMVD
jgi:NAD(P)-dependent dehydrogenase (short-subunit alcohol dehydrogenase family)